MGKDKKITLSLANKDRLKRVAKAMGVPYSQLVDEILDPVLESMEKDALQVEEASAPHRQRMARHIQGNSTVLDAYRKGGDDA